MCSVYYIYKHRILFLNLGTGILKSLERIGAKSEFIVTHLGSAWALTAAGQGDVLNMPERSTAGDLKFPDSLWDRGLDPHLTTAMQIMYFLPYMQVFNPYLRFSNRHIYTWQWQRGTSVHPALNPLICLKKTMGAGLLLISCPKVLKFVKPSFLPSNVFPGVCGGVWHPVARRWLCLVDWGTTSC